MMGTLLSIQPRATGGGGRSPEEILKEQGEDLRDKVPPKFDLDVIVRK